MRCIVGPHSDSDLSKAEAALARAEVMAGAVRRSLRIEPAPLPEIVKEAIIRLAESLARTAARMDHERAETDRKP